MLSPRLDSKCRRGYCNTMINFLSTDHGQTSWGTSPISLGPGCNNNHRTSVVTLGWSSEPLLESSRHSAYLIFSGSRTLLSLRVSRWLSSVLGITLILKNKNFQTIFIPFNLFKTLVGSFPFNGVYVLLQNQVRNWWQFNISKKGIKLFFNLFFVALATTTPQRLYT